MIYMNVPAATSRAATPGTAPNLTTRSQHYVGSGLISRTPTSRTGPGTAGGWNMDGGTTDNDQSQTGSNIRTFTISRSFLGLLGNCTILFDVGTGWRW